MSPVKTLLKITGALALVVVLAGAAVYARASAAADALLSRTVETHTVEIPVPYPLDAAEVAERGLSDEEAQQLAMERAVDRGRHLVESRYACTTCHGEDFGGGVMVDAFPMGTFLGPNLTSGAGGVTAGYTMADWDRIVRHGVRPDGTPAVMPSVDFFSMTDQELSDIVAYIGSLPPVDAEVPGRVLGPLGKVLLWRGDIVLSADLADHQAAHVEVPPAADVSAEFGAHLAAVCAGCHGQDFSGSVIPGGDPSWPPAADLRPSPEGLGEWTYAQFVTAMREGVRPDGVPLRVPMTDVLPYARKMTDTELEALWTYLRSLPPGA